MPERKRTKRSTSKQKHTCTCSRSSHKQPLQPCSNLELLSVQPTPTTKTEDEDTEKDKTTTATSINDYNPSISLFCFLYTTAILLTLITTVTATNTKYPIHSQERILITQHYLCCLSCGLIAICVSFPKIVFNQLLLPYFQLTGTVLELFMFRIVLVSICWIITSPNHMYELDFQYANPPPHFRFIVNFFISLNASTSSILSFLRWFIRIFVCLIPSPFSFRNHMINRIFSVIISLLVMIYVGLTTQMWYSGGHRNQIVWMMLLANSFSPKIKWNPFQTIGSQTIPINIPCVAMFVLSICYFGPGFWKLYVAGIDYVIDPLHLKMLTEEISICRNASPLLRLDTIPNSLMPFLSFSVLIFEIGFPFILLVIGPMKYGRCAICIGGIALHFSLGLFLGNYFYFTPLLLTYFGLIDYKHEL